MKVVLKILIANTENQMIAVLFYILWCQHNLYFYFHSIITQKNVLSL